MSQIYIDYFPPVSELHLFYYFDASLFIYFPRVFFTEIIFYFVYFFRKDICSASRKNVFFIYLAVFLNISLINILTTHFYFNALTVKLYKSPTLMFLEQKIKRWIFPEKGLQTQSFWSKPLIKEEICMFLRVANFYFKDIKM